MGKGVTMMDKQRRLDKAAKKHMDATMESYKTVWDLFAQAQGSPARLSQGLFEGALSYLQSQAELNLNASEELVEQVRRGEEASRDLAGASARAYDEFVDSLFLYYRESMKATASKPPPESHDKTTQTT